MKLARLSLLLVTSALTLGPAHGQAHVSRAGVQFYFSDAGGSHERLTLDYVTSSDWTGEYDVIVKNTRTEAIQFDFGVVLIGFALATGAGGAAQMIPGSDKVTLYNIAAAGVVANQNPNITARAPWFVGDVMPTLVGGRGVPFPQPRPYGLNLPMDPVNWDLVPLAPDETMFLARIAFRDNGLFASEGIHSLVLFDYYPSPSINATTALSHSTSELVITYHDGPNWEENSRLRLAAVPEPSTLSAIAAAFALGFLRRKRR